MPQFAMPELYAMQQIAEIVADLTPAERRRVSAWFSEYAQDSTSQEAFVPAEQTVAIEPPAEPIDTDASVEDKAYDSFTAFYEAASPKKGAQKAAVAGYWLETTQGQKSWKASEVNKLLKSIDVKVSSMSIVLTNAVKASNPLITELERLGDSERSRKTFCLSDAGIAYVQAQLA